MATQKVNISKISPVLMAFFVMSFVDLVGIGVDRVSKDMSLSATVAQLIPSAAFLWFFILSVPVGVLQSRLGKKAMLNIRDGSYSPGIARSFLLLFLCDGAGRLCTFRDRKYDCPGFSQPVACRCRSREQSFEFSELFTIRESNRIDDWSSVGRILCLQFGDWKLLFLVFGIVSILTVLWLGSAKINETRVEGYKATFASSFKLLKTGYVLLIGTFHFSCCRS